MEKTGNSKGFRRRQNGLSYFLIRNPLYKGEQFEYSLNTSPTIAYSRSTYYKGLCRKLLYMELKSFSAVLDYVGRAHGIAICPSSVVRPSSGSVRPSVSQLSLNLMHGFLSNFTCSFPWAIRSDLFFLILEKKNILFR